MDEKWKEQKLEFPKRFLISLKIRKKSSSKCNERNAGNLIREIFIEEQEKVSISLLNEFLQ